MEKNIFYDFYMGRSVRLIANRQTDLCIKYIAENLINFESYKKHGETMLFDWTA